MPLPPVNLVHHDLPLQPIPAQLRQQHRPDDPVHAACDDDADADDAVQVVRQRLVDAVAVRGRDEGRDRQVDVAEEEEDGDGEGGFYGRGPVPGRGVQVEVDEGAGDEDVDDGEGVGDYAGGRRGLVLAFFGFLNGEGGEGEGRGRKELTSG